MQKGLECGYHVGQGITNFCEDEQCLMPLCPKCLPIHMSDHKQRKTYALLSSIDDAFIKAEDIISAWQERLQARHLKHLKVNQHANEQKAVLLHQIAEAMNRVVSEVQSYFKELARKCEGLFDSSEIFEEFGSLLSSQVKIEHEMLELQRFKLGLSSREKSLMSLICVFRSGQESLNPTVGRDSEQVTSEMNFGSVRLRVDVSRLTDLHEMLSSYAKIASFSKFSIVDNDVTFSKKKVAPLHPSQDGADPNSDVEEDNNSILGSDYNRRIDYLNPTDKADDIYQLNDPAVIRLRQRREDMMIQSQQRDITKQKLSPPMSPKVANNQFTSQSHRLRSEERKLQTNKQNKVEIQNGDYQKLNLKEKEMSLTEQDSSLQQSQNSFVTFERPNKEHLQKYARPEEVRFLEQVQEKSQRMQHEFDEQQKEIFMSAMNYKIPQTPSMLEQGRQVPNHQFHRQINQFVDRPAQAISLGYQNYRQTVADSFDNQSETSVLSESILAQQMSSPKNRGDGINKAHLPSPQGILKNPQVPSTQQQLQQRWM